MLPTILISLAIAAICGAIVARGIHNKRHGRSGCSGLCHAGREETTPPQEGA